ncbi:Phospholipid hydroperoxide glutathione peroxidase-like [Homarus americanus]|uniref:Glutathione peroxidase n=1 Tax=Homarus americanus TaxID=6706 RepID=A0A8J5N602_HOMAM|nr:Phospholipid hydroperoxide glutathione peroxidase-like [Homarus americanus]
MASGGSSFYDFSAPDIDGNDVAMEKYRGHVCIVVNVATKGLCILGFPCNQFGSQEPGTEEEIKKFAESYGVKFDMFSKVKVNGNDAHPLWNFLKSKQGGILGNFIKWNFTKFLIDKEGIPVSRYSPQTNPIPTIEKDLEKLL